MVKLSIKGAQDPADSSLQMKVPPLIILRLGSTSSSVANYPLSNNPILKFLPSVFSPGIRSLLNLNSGTT